MPRPHRISAGNTCYHVMKSGNGRSTVFHKDGDYIAFLKLLKQASDRVPMRLLAFCLMPNHFHLVVWTRKEGELNGQLLETSLCGERTLRRLHRLAYEEADRGHLVQPKFF